MNLRQLTRLLPKPRLGFTHHHPVAYRGFCTASMEKLKVKEEPTIEKEILFKMEYFQFDEASKYIKNMVSSQGVVSVDFYNKVLLKAIQKNNVKLALEIFDFTRDAVQPNDTTYITLIEALLEKDRINEAFGLFCQAYLQDQVLDLLVVERMLDAAKRARLPSTYITLLHKLATKNFTPSRSLFDKFLKSAMRLKTQEREACLAVMLDDMKSLKIDYLDQVSTMKKKSKKKSKTERYILKKNPMYKGASKDRQKYVIVDPKNGAPMADTEGRANGYEGEYLNTEYEDEEEDGYSGESDSDSENEDGSSSEEEDVMEVANDDEIRPSGRPRRT